MDTRLAKYALLFCTLAASVRLGAQQATEPPVDAADSPAQRSVVSAAEASAAIEPAVNVSAPPQDSRAEPAEPRPRPQIAQNASPRVLDTLDLGTTSITGNQELPKVLYIVPWKRSDLGDLVGRPVNTLLDEALAPVDPEVFERHLDYYETLYGEIEQE